MRKTIFPIIIGCISLSLTFLPVHKAGSRSATANSYTFNAISTSVNHTGEDDETSVAAANAIYEELELSKLGLSLEAMQYAYKGYQHLLKKGVVCNSNLLTICDFSQRSNKKRMYIIDISNQKVYLTRRVSLLLLKSSLP